MTGDPFDLARAQFMTRAAAPDVSANVLKLGYVIAYKHMNVESKTAVVSQETLAADLNMTVRTIQSLLANAGDIWAGDRAGRRSRQT